MANSSIIICIDYAKLIRSHEIDGWDEGKNPFCRGWIEMSMVLMQYYADEHCMDARRILYCFLMVPCWFFLVEG